MSERVRIDVAVRVATDGIGYQTIDVQPGDVIELREDIAANLVAGKLATPTSEPVTVNTPTPADPPRRTGIGPERSSRGATSWPGDPGAKAARWSAGTKE